MNLFFYPSSTIQVRNQVFISCLYPSSTVQVKFMSLNQLLIQELHHGHICLPNYKCSTWWSNNCNPTNFRIGRPNSFVLVISNLHDWESFVTGSLLWIFRILTHIGRDNQMSDIRKCNNVTEEWILACNQGPYCWCKP